MGQVSGIELTDNKDIGSGVAELECDIPVYLKVSRSCPLPQFGTDCTRSLNATAGNFKLDYKALNEPISPIN